jgi:ribosome maturation factor RimP
MVESERYPGGLPMPAVNRRLLTDDDFQDAMERQIGIRVFEHDHIVQSGGAIVRFDERSVVIQASVSDISYFPRTSCEFFELKKK